MRLPMSSVVMAWMLWPSLMLISAQTEYLTELLNCSSRLASSKSTFLSARSILLPRTHTTMSALAKDSTSGSQ